MLAPSLVAPAQCRSARFVFDTMDHHLMVAAMFNGYHPARLVVDDAQHPASAFAWVGPHGYVAGEAHNATFNAALRHVINAEFPIGTIFRLYFPNAEWEEVLQHEVLHGRHITRKLRDAYTRPAARTNWQARVTAPITLHPVDEVIDQTGLKHHERLIAEIESCNPSVEAFLDRGFGIIALDGDHTLAGWCLSENWSDGRCEVGIETVEAYQRQGLATSMALAFTEMAYEHGLAQIGWHCWSDHTASCATAIKAGFEKACEYPALIVE